MTIGRGLPSAADGSALSNARSTGPDDVQYRLTDFVIGPKAHVLRHDVRLDTTLMLI